jgi:hypothetical protein
MTMSKSKAKKISAIQPTPAPEQAQPANALGADAPMVESPKPADEIKTPRAPRDQRNGITRPTEGKCRAVWDALDALKADGKELTFEALRLAVDRKIADATTRTQRQRWKQYNAEKKDGQ